MAANTRDIRRRIKSIKNTAQITKAMQMVAASKMRKAQAAAVAGRPYADLMNRVLVSLSRRTNPELSPLLEVREVKKELVLVVSTDKGLCGGLNTNLLREVQQFGKGPAAYVATGRKAVQFLARTKKELIADFHLKDAPGLLDTKPISKFLIDKFLSREVDRVSVIYTRFVNTLTLKPTVQTILPISPPTCRSPPAPSPPTMLTASSFSTNRAPPKSWPASCRITSTSRFTRWCSTRARPSTARGWSP